MTRLLRPLLTLLFVVAGVLHLVRPRPFVRIVPAWVPAPEAMVAVSGVAEVVGGVGLLVPRTRRVAGVGLTALLVAVFPANIEMLVHRERAGGGLPTWLLAARLPLQPALAAAVLLASRRP